MKEGLTRYSVQTAQSISQAVRQPHTSLEVFAAQAHEKAVSSNVVITSSSFGWDAFAVGKYSKKTDTAQIDSAYHGISVAYG